MNSGNAFQREFFDYLRFGNRRAMIDENARPKRMTIMMKPSFFTLLLSIVLLCFSACGDPSGDAPLSPNSSVDSTKNKSGKKGEDLDEIIQQYEPPGRVVWQKPEMVIEKMGDLSEKTVADLGAGSGFFARRLAQHAEKVIALDLRPDLISFIDSTKMELKPEYRERLETRLVTPTDSQLKPNEADLILIVNTYIYIENRAEYLKHLLSVLPEGGQVLIVDFKKKRMPIRIPPHSIRLELFEVENELDAAGFSRIISDDQSLDYQYIVMAEK